MNGDRDPLARLAAADPARADDPATAEDAHTAEALLARVMADPGGDRRVGGRRLGRGARRDLGRVAAVGLAIVIVVCGLVLTDPFGGGDDRGVLERASAAIGAGPVLHLVTEQSTGAEIVDLASGVRRPLALEAETWFDPRRGMRQTMRFDGMVIGEYGTAVGGPVRQRAVARYLQIFRRDYREALDDGSARVLREDQIDGEPVYWLRIPVGPGDRSGASCGERRHSCRDVAISRETYEPRYVGASAPGAGRPRRFERIVEVENLPDAAVAVPGPYRQAGTGFDTSPQRPVDRTMAARLLDGGLVWPGTRIGGLRLASLAGSGFRTFEFNGQMRRPRYGPAQSVVRLVYGAERDIASGRSPSTWDPVLAIQQSKSDRAVQIVPGFDFLNRVDAGPASPGYIPPVGEAVLGAGGYQAVLRQRGVAIMVLGSSPRLVTDAIEALKRG